MLSRLETDPRLADRRTHRQGMDPEGLAVIDDDARAVYPCLRSVLVVRHGVLVFEHYYHGATPATSFNVFSVTKSLTSALAGIALGEHALGGLQQPIGRLLATHLPPNPDPRLRRATLEQVLTMTAGLPADPADGSPPSLVHASDWVRFVLSQHPLATPGGRFAYSSDGSHLLSAIVADSTGQPTLRYAQAKLFGPLGIPSDHPFQPVFAPRNQAAYRRAGFAWPRVITWQLTGESPKDHRLDWHIDQAARAALETELFGKHVLITSRDDWPAADVVAAYRSQSDAEFSFRQMKDPHVVSFSPMHHWTDHNIRVHLFTCVLALVTAHLMRRHAARHGMHMSVRALLDALAGIEEGVLIYPSTGGRPKARRMLTEMSPDQQKLYAIFSLDRRAPRA